MVAAAVIDQCRLDVREVAAQLLATSKEPADGRAQSFALQINCFVRQVPGIEQLATCLVMIAVPEQMAQAADAIRDHIDATAMDRLERTHASQRLFYMTYPHGDVPPVQNVMNVAFSCPANQFR